MFQQNSRTFSDGLDTLEGADNLLVVHAQGLRELARVDPLLPCRQGVKQRLRHILRCAGRHDVGIFSSCESQIRRAIKLQRTHPRLQNDSTDTRPL